MWAVSGKGEIKNSFTHHFCFAAPVCWTLLRVMWKNNRSMWNQCFQLGLCRGGACLLTGDAHGSALGLGLVEWTCSSQPVVTLRKRSWDENLKIPIPETQMFPKDVLYINARVSVMFPPTWNQGIVCSHTKWWGQVFWQNYLRVCSLKPTCQRLVSAITLCMALRWGGVPEGLN